MFDRKHPYVKGHATSVAFPGVIMLVYSQFGGLPAHMDEHGALYNFSTDLFRYMLLIGGLVFLAIAAFCLSGRLVAMLSDAAVSFLCGGIMVACSIIWMATFKAVMLNSIMFVIIGFILIRSGMGALDMYRRLIVTAPDAPTASPSAPQTPPAQHPASKASSALPKDGEPPPPEGYLAALSKEKDE